MLNREFSIRKYFLSKLHGYEGTLVILLITEKTGPLALRPGHILCYGKRQDELIQGSSCFVSGQDISAGNFPMPDFKIVPLATPFHHASRQKEQAQSWRRAWLAHVGLCQCSASSTWKAWQTGRCSTCSGSQGRPPRPQLLALDFQPTLISGMDPT